MLLWEPTVLENLLFFSAATEFLRPQKGDILFHGKPVSYKRKELLALRAKVGIVFQDPDKQLFSASVEQEISFGILNLGVAKEQARTEVEQVMEELEIVPFRKRPVHALSGGQKKQVSIADILVMKPEIIILDEPAAALDPKHTLMVNRIVDRLTEQGITVLISTHDVDYAMAWADDVFSAEGRKSSDAWDSPAGILQPFRSGSHQSSAARLPGII